MQLYKFNPMEVKVKRKILNWLKENSSEFISGERLSNELGVSRTAVWKYIKELQKKGYPIEASSKKGYKLSAMPDIVNEYEISCKLNTKIIGRKILYLKTIDSTNALAKKIAHDGCEDGTLVVADCQTAGRGRLGRSWNSMDSKGVWMSVVLKPAIAPENVQLITLAASVAVAVALEKVTGVAPGIKWPNDLILDGKKVCGILTEMSSEIDRVNFLVLGIGINVSHEVCDFPEEIRKTATSLRSFAVDKGLQHVDFNRSEIVKAILVELEQFYSWINKGEADKIINSWKGKSITLGKEIKIISRSEEYTGFAEDITGDGKLVVRCNDGTRRCIFSGEISVRGVMDYI